MSQPRITVVTPSFNHGRFLERAICSVLDQGYSNLEYWVIDAGSSDQTHQVRRHYEHDLAGWITTPNLGLADAINQGLGRATGQIVGILAPEDLYLPGALEAVANRMELADGPQWAVGRCVRMGTGDQMLGWMAPSAPRSPAAFLMHDSGVLPTASSFYRRELIERHGLFAADLPLACDYEYACRLLAAGEQPEILTATLVARRETPEGVDSRQMLAAGLEYIAAARRHAEQLPVRQRYALWRNCDERERIYKLAEAETQGEHARGFIWQQLLRHPWWLADDAVRRALRQNAA